MLKPAGILLILIANCHTLLAVDKHLIESKHLGYKVRYWVYVPKDVTQKMPVLYVTDGAWYKENGLTKISSSLVQHNKVAPHIIVMVDAIDPDNPSLNRRNSQFLCNSNYLNFYKEELIPAVTRQYNTLNSREQRGILGVSFGGLNSMYFAMYGSDVFSKIGIQSPAPHPCPAIYSDFENSPKLPIDIFLSTGIMNDKADPTRRFKRVLDRKGYDFMYLEVAEGHNWKNWKPLLDDILLYFYGINE